VGTKRQGRRAPSRTVGETNIDATGSIAVLATCHFGFSADAGFDRTGVDQRVEYDALDCSGARGGKGAAPLLMAEGPLGRAALDTMSASQLDSLPVWFNYPIGLIGESSTRAVSDW
jgi:hypothetical protein